MLEVHSCSIRREIGEIWTDSTAFAVDQFLRRRLLVYTGEEREKLPHRPGPADAR